jgi:hypothetical protein
LVFLVTLSASPLVAQSGGSISGTVVDPTGAAIAGANVSLVETVTGHHSAAKTNSSGQYEFASLLSGHYLVTVAAAGFRTFETIETQLTSNQSLRVDARLLVGATSSTVEVSAATAPYSTLDDSSGTRIDSPLIQVPQSVEVLDRTLL